MYSLAASTFVNRASYSRFRNSRIPDCADDSVKTLAVKSSMLRALFKAEQKARDGFKGLTIYEIFNSIDSLGFQLAKVHGLIPEMTGNSMDGADKIITIKRVSNDRPYRYRLTEAGKEMAQQLVAEQ